MHSLRLYTLPQGRYDILLRSLPTCFLQQKYTLSVLVTLGLTVDVVDTILHPFCEMVPAEWNKACVCSYPLSIVLYTTSVNTIMKWFTLLYGYFVHDCQARVMLWSALLSFKLEDQGSSLMAGPPLKAHTYQTRFPKATRFSIFKTK